MKILHIVGGSSNNGAYKGAKILHQALTELNVESKILNDNPTNSDRKDLEKKNINVFYINDNFFKKIINQFYVSIEKTLKSLYLKSPRSTFTIGILGFDITKIKEYKDADIIHIHWLNQGFIKLKSLSKIKKPVVWTMRDMWPFTGGSHYTMDFKEYEESNLSKFLQKFKKKNYPQNVKFVAISDWLKKEAEKSNVLNNHNITRIYNNIDIRDFNLITKDNARSIVKISTKKKIILYGAHNPQNERKGWKVFVETLKKLDKSKYFLLIFGNFWSYEVLDQIGIEYKILGFINDKKILNAVYSSSDIFVFSSIQEAFGKTWAEAMACEIPVVCFNNTSVSEVVDHKINGYIVEKINPDELKKGIDWMSAEVEKNNYSNNTSRTKIISFDAKNIARKYIKLYKELLVSKSSNE